MRILELTSTVHAVTPLLPQVLIISFHEVVHDEILRTFCMLSPLADDVLLLVYQANDLL